jgi:hypothetical protein
LTDQGHDEASGRGGAIGSAERSAGRAIDALKPAQYLALVILVSGMFGGLLVYLDRREEARDTRILPIIAGCLRQPA